MGKWINDTTGAIVSVADEKDYRFAGGWHSADAPAKPSEEPKRSPGRPKKSEDEK